MSQFNDLANIMYMKKKTNKNAKTGDIINA